MTVLSERTPWHQDAAVLNSPGTKINRYSYSLDSFY